ncbi:MAG: PEP-CTERM sorting domain-containing protein, partial [Alphaproteobacteria bacterium]|nr:PEP-CTERM sorting domain-containing protein [Alphaproteobacteria bacterium]
RILVSGDLFLEGNIIFQLATGVSDDIFEQDFDITDFILDFNPSTNEEMPFTDLALFANASYFVQLGNSIFDVAFNPDDGTFDVSSIPESPGVGVPEPGTLVLFGVGMLGLAVVRRRRNAASAGTRVELAG